MRGLPGLGPAAALLLFRWWYCFRCKPGLGPAAASLSLASPRESKQREGEPEPGPLLSPVTTAVGTELRSLAFGIVNSRDSQQPNFPSIERSVPSASAARRDTQKSACKVSAANAHVVSGPRSPAMETVPSSAAAGGSGLALFERSEFSQTPPDASSAGNPQGTVSGSPFLWFVSFGEAKEMNSAAGPRPGSPRTK